MGELKVVLQFIAVLFLIFLLSLLYKVGVAYFRRKRIKDFAINIDMNNTGGSVVFSLIFKTSSFLEKLVIFNGVARTYDEYIDEDSRLNKGMDYISIKLYMSLLFIGMYLLLVLLYKQSIDITIILISFIIGYIIPDFYCLHVSNKKSNITYDNIYNAIIIMENSYKVGRSTEQAILDIINRSDGNLKKEFKRVLSDIKIGIDVHVAFERMYKRTRNITILELSNLLYSVSKSGVSPSLALNELEKRIIKQDKFIDKVMHLYNINLLVYLVNVLIPLLVIIYMLFYRIDFIKFINCTCGEIIIVILFILYMLYSFIIWKIAKEVK